VVCDGVSLFVAFWQTTCLARYCDLRPAPPWVGCSRTSWVPGLLSHLLGLLSHLLGLLSHLLGLLSHLLGRVSSSCTWVSNAPPRVSDAPPRVSNAPPRVSIAPPRVSIAPPRVSIYRTSSGVYRTSSGVYRRSHSLCALGTRASHVGVVEVVAFPLAWCRHSTLFQVPVSATSCLSSAPPVLPYYQELLRSLVSTCFNNQFWLCSLVLLSLTAEPPTGTKPQTGDLESVLPSTCSLLKLTPRASRPLSVHFYSASLDFAPASPPWRLLHRAEWHYC
jgi:hypothetical protein